MTKGGASLLININPRAQEEYFGETIIDENVSVDWAYDKGLPHLRLSLMPDGQVTATKSIRGTARLSIAAFGSGLPGDKTTTDDCTIVDHDEDTGALTLALPEIMRLPAMPGKAG